MATDDIVSVVSPKLLQEARGWRHPAIATRVDFANESLKVHRPEIPSLIVCGGTRDQRDLTAACYVNALIEAGLCEVSDVMAVDEVDLDDLDPDDEMSPEVNQAVRRSYDRARHAEVLIVRDVGVARRSPALSNPDTYGHAPFRLDDIANERHNWMRPTILCTDLPVGNPVGADLTVNDPPDRPAVTESDNAIIVEMRGPNRGLTTALDDRARAGWRVPSREAGFDPDGRLVEPGTHSLQAHLGGRVWWRIYKPARGTAIDAGELEPNI